MKRTDDGKQFKKIWEKYGAAVLILLVGVVLLLMPDGKTEEKAQAAEAETETLLQTEARMKKILGRIRGVGKLDLMLTVESGPRQELAVDTELSYRGSTAAPDDYERRTETVVISGGEGETPVVEYSVSPSYRGAVVVCEGADDAAVRLAVTQAMSALTGLGADRIVVIRCQS